MGSYYEFVPEFKFFKKYDHYELSAFIRENIDDINEQLREGIQEKDYIFPKPADLNIKTIPYIYNDLESDKGKIFNYFKPKRLHGTK